MYDHCVSRHPAHFPRLCNRGCLSTCNVSPNLVIESNSCAGLLKLFNSQLPTAQQVERLSQLWIITVRNEN